MADLNLRLGQTVIVDAVNDDEASADLARCGDAQ